MSTKSKDSITVAGKRSLLWAQKLLLTMVNKAMNTIVYVKAC